MQKQTAGKSVEKSEIQSDENKARKAAGKEQWEQRKAEKQAERITKRMQKSPHDDAWFAKQEARLQEPIKNTLQYYTKKQVALMWCGLFPALGLIPLGIGLYKFISLRRQYKSYSNLSADFMRNGRAVTLDGTPGSGKTFTGSNVAYILACECWEELKRTYYTQRTMKAQWIKEGDIEKLTLFRAIEESYIFFALNEDRYIPCLISSVPLKEYGSGRMSYKLTPELFLLAERNPECSVFFYDESGLSQGTHTSTTENADILEFWRFCRQFFDGRFVCTNQDSDQNAVYMRRSTDFSCHIYGQEPFEYPDRLKAKYDRRERRFYKLLYRGTLTPKHAEYVGQELYYMDKYISTIGFRRITYSFSSRNGAAGGVERLTLPAIGFVQYDDRAFRNKYKCKDKPIRLEGWQSLAIDEDSKVDFVQEIKGEAKSKRGGS